MILSVNEAGTEISITGGLGGASVTVWQNSFSDALAGTSVTLSGGGAATVTGSTLGLGAGTVLNGVWKFFDGANAPVGILVSNSIDCCLAKKMDAYLTKSTCSCGKCKNELETMAEIYLLLQTARASLSMDPNPEFANAYTKYAKADTLCTDTTCKSCSC
jgi:hypothetical protein